MAPLQKPDMGDFDIVATYHRLLREDPDITMPVAAIESLVELLAYSQASTVSETLDLLATSTAHLKSSVSNPISLSAGTDLFQRYLINALQKPHFSSASASGSMHNGSGGAVAGAGVGDFRSIRQHLISNGRLFVTRAKESRNKIAAFGRHFVRDGNTVLTNGGSRVVGALLKHAAEDSRGSVRFRVIYVLKSAGSTFTPSSTSFTTSISTDNKAKATITGEGMVNKSAMENGRDQTDNAGDTNKPRQDTRRERNEEFESEGHAIVRTLRSKGVPVAVIGEGAVGYAMGLVDMVIVGAEGVVENGGIISRLGTYQIGLLAKAARKPFYVVAESHKFVRLYPLSQYDLPIEQRVVEFKTADEDQERREEEEGKEKWGRGVDVAVDFTPPDLISALITESGVLTPSAVSEELIKIWF